MVWESAGVDFRYFMWLCEIMCFYIFQSFFTSSVQFVVGELSSYFAFSVLFDNNISCKCILVELCMWDWWCFRPVNVIVGLMSMVACSFGFSGFIYCIGHVKIHKCKVLVCVLSWMCFSSSLIGHTGLIQIHENFLLCYLNWCWHKCIRNSFPLCFAVGLN